MEWIITAKYSYPGPIFYRTDKVLLEQNYPYYRIMGQGFIETRINGKGTCYSQVHIYAYGQCGLHTLELSRHWVDTKAQGNKARAWCEYLLKYPPRYYSDEWDISSETLNDEWDISSETLNTMCKQQMD